MEEIIYFISNKQHKVVNTANLTRLSVDEGRVKLVDYIKNLEQKVIALDTETTGIDAYIYDVLCVIIGGQNNIDFVLDATCEDTKNLTKSLLKYLYNEKYIIVGSNLKFDLKMLIVNFNTKFDKKCIYDTEIAERRLWQNLGISASNPTGIRFSLKDTLLRRFKEIPKGMDKEIREEFINKKVDTFIFENRHVEYAAGDTRELLKLRSTQLLDIVKYNLEFLIFEIEQPLVYVLAKAELKGFRFNVERWEELSRIAEKTAYKYALQLDEEVQNLIKLHPERRKYFISTRYMRKRNEPVIVNNIGLFGEPIGNKEIFGIKKKTLNFSAECFNYESPTQLIDFFARLNQAFPTKRGTYEVPILGERDKITNSYEEFSGIEGNLSNYLLEKPDSIMKKFLELLLEYRFHSTRASNFGMNFINTFLNKKTNRLHTIFRQCHATTGRLQSGDKDNGYYNAQNVPADPEYRHCFIADDGYSIGTYDLSGAETIIMASKAQDEELIRMAIIEDDIHSPLAQESWRNIYYFRVGRYFNIWTNSKEYFKLKDSAKDYLTKAVNMSDNSTIKTYWNNAVNLSITKKDKKIRTAFKPMTFGTVYGMYSKKAGKTLNISAEEGQIVIDTIKSKIPKTFAMVERNAKFSIENGYLILNTRTNSRMWFSDVIKLKKYNIPLEFITKSEIESVSRNAPIQGTQADMVKEAMVEIDEYIERNNLDVHLLKQVHDELVYLIPKKYDGHSEEYKKEKEANVNHINMHEIIMGFMTEVANRYLINIEMQVSGEVAPYWVK
jgi:DNA polymerase I-like protein with 3'-5' exonuclease and polymerase domains